MNKQVLHAASNDSWLEAAKTLINTAQQIDKELRSLIIKEDAKSMEGKFRLKAKLR